MAVVNHLPVITIQLRRNNLCSGESPTLSPAIVRTPGNSFQPGKGKYEVYLVFLENMTKNNRPSAPMTAIGSPPVGVGVGVGLVTSVSVAVSWVV